MQKQTPLIAVDWGTTNRRAYRIDPCSRHVAMFEDALGVLAVPTGGFPAAIAAIRSQLGDHPMLLAGMVGSNRGWIEVPYVAAPASLAELAAAIHWVGVADVGIIPGVAMTTGGVMDVMRGEEVQAFGAAVLAPTHDRQRLCHPGTHAKWLDIEAGRLTRFRTRMTGEVFALLRDHSILGPQLQGKVGADAGFLAGVQAVLNGEDLLAALFAVRARTVLGAGDNWAAYASGILIGSDVVAGVGSDPTATAVVTLVGSPNLCDLYAAALQLTGHDSVSVDGGSAFVAGISAIMECC